MNQIQSLKIIVAIILLFQITLIVWGVTLIIQGDLFLGTIIVIGNTVFGIININTLLTK